MLCLPEGDKQFSEPCWHIADRTLRMESQLQFEPKYKWYISIRCIWKCCLGDGGHFVHARMYQNISIYILCWKTLFDFSAVNSQTTRLSFTFMLHSVVMLLNVPLNGHRMRPVLQKTTMSECNSNDPMPKTNWFYLQITPWMTVWSLKNASCNCSLVIPTLSVIHSLHSAAESWLK